MKKIGNALKFFILFSLILLNQAWGSSFQVSASVDRDQMGIGDSFTLNLRITGDDDFNIEAPQIPAVAGLEPLNSWAGGRQSSSSMSVVNGKAQFSKTVSQDYNYQFSPQKEGTFIVPVIDISLGGQNYKTNPIKIQVKEEFRGSSGTRSKKVPGRPQFQPGQDEEDESPFGSNGQIPDAEDLFNQLMKQRQRMFGQLPNQGQGFGSGAPQAIPSRKLDINTNESFFIYLDLDKTEVYEGEQVTANWHVYTRGNLESLDRVKFPDLKGFWKEIIEEVPSLQFTPEIVNGIQYQKALLASHALFPIKAGTAVIDEFRIKGRVRISTQFGWGQPHEYTRASRRVAIKVLPLPMEGRTQSFSGAVGSYRISLKTEGTNFPANQPFSIKLRFEGIGNAKLIDLPNIQWPDALEIFDTKNESKFYKDGQSFKEFEILAIPRKDGEMVIPPITFSYFDPEQKKYLTQKTEEIKLMISPGSAQGVGINSTNLSGGKGSANDKEAEFRAQPILELPQSSFAFSENRLLIYGTVAGLMLLFLAVQFLMQMRGFHQEPEFQQLVDAKIKLIENQKDERKIGSESVNLIYLLGAYLAGQKKANQEWQHLIKEIPLKSQNLYLSRLSDLFEYFQLLGFSPDDVKNRLLAGNPIETRIQDLRKITQEIASQAKAEEQG
jgi:hypothetical protein